MRAARRGLRAQPLDVVRIAARPVPADCGGEPAIRDVSPELRGGEANVLLGANGAGKITTWGAMTGILPVTTGHVERDSRRIDGNLWQHARAVADQAAVLSRGSVVAPGAGAVIRADFGLIGAAYLEGTPEVAGGADF
jgi:ABC-type cobalamin/Fe3+-siderophores transport system ATPase subunit